MDVLESIREKVSVRQNILMHSAFFYCTARTLPFIISWMQLLLCLLTIATGIICFIHKYAIVQSLRVSTYVYNELTPQFHLFEIQLLAATLICKGTFGSLLMVVVMVEINKENDKLLKDWWIILTCFVFVFVLPCVTITLMKESSEISFLIGTTEIILSFLNVWIFRIYAQQLDKKQNSPFPYRN